ncbi:MAG: hypothetical protein EOM24_16175 [Chloroflexia bacterium]|nr:hypothetical protein [Chloroflexia bacterium]
MLHEQRGHPPLDEAFEQVVGANAWSILVKTGSPPLLPKQALTDRPLLFGLRHCRHRVIHGMQSPPQRELELLGRWGANAVRQLLHPQTGWPSLLGWNAQMRLPALRRRVKRKS